MNGMQYWLISLFFFPLVAAAQVKYEQEYRVKPAETPEEAREFIEGAVSDLKIKWYKEVQLDAVSFEAKFRLNRRKYSVEFDTLGQVEDVEVEWAFSEIPAAAREQVEGELDNAFSRYRVQKVQRQWTGPASVLQGLILGVQPSPEEYVTKYELVVRGKREGMVKLFELLFDEHGRQVQMSEIIPRNTDILDF